MTAPRATACPVGDEHLVPTRADLRHGRDDVAGDAEHDSDCEKPSTFLSLAEAALQKISYEALKPGPLFLDRSAPGILDASDLAFGVRPGLARLLRRRARRHLQIVQESGLRPYIRSVEARRRRAFYCRQVTLGNLAIATYLDGHEGQASQFTEPTEHR